MSKTRIAVLGAGWWAAENHIPLLKKRPDVEVAGVCRLGREELDKVQKHFEIPFGTEDYHELLALKDLEGVVISSPHRLHYAHAAAALEKGLHVMCEKPMTLHASEARKLADLAQSHRLHFVIPYGWNYTDYSAKARTLIEQGEIGEIEHVLCHMASALRDLFSGTGAWFAEEAFFKPQIMTWSDPAGGGGFAHGQLTHALGLLYWITKLQPAEVFCFSRSSPSGADLFDAISCRFANGATGMLGGAGTMPPRSTYQVDIRVFGKKGMLLLDLERPRLEVRRNDGRNTVVPLKAQPGEYSCVEPVERFIDLIQRKTGENCSNASLGADVVATLDAAVRSAISGTIEAIEN